jgi:uncharacterized membrane protein YfcA
VSPLRLVLTFLAAGAGAAVNAVAGGGTLVTFPAIVGLGISPLIANATSTVALWPGSLSSMWGYRGELKGARRWVVAFTAPSLLGGALGAWLLLHTSADRFDQIVPFLVLGATLLFLLQPLLMRRLRNRRLGAPQRDNEDAEAGFPPAFLLGQFAVAVYGGYFGAGIGILMLAVLGFMGLGNIHRMNGLKNWGGLCINAMAVILFSIGGIVNWPVALTMAVGGILGGYLGSRFAQRMGERRVRRAIVVIGLGSFLFLLVRR